MGRSVVIVTTGHEILRGETRDTNAEWLSREVTAAGGEVVERRVVGDGRCELEGVLGSVIDPNGFLEFVLVTGGLGPTEDDRTREALAAALHVPVVENAAAWEMVQQRFALLGRDPEPMQRRQARMPEGAVPLPNEVGTAPGIWIAPYPSWPFPRPFVAALPGPPREMRAMFTAEVLPRWRALGELDETALRVVWTAGAPESEVASAIDDLMKAKDPTVGTHPDEGEVLVRILARGAGAVARAQEVQREVVRRLGTHVVSGMEEDRLASVIVRTLAKRHEIVATAESITGGLVARMLVAVPGASDAFRGGFVAYSDEWKSSVLGVDAALVREHGAVSEPVALAMARSARERGRCAWGLATTGVAGPGADDRGALEGTVFVAVSSARGDRARALRFAPPRESIQRRAAVAALDLLRRALLDA